MGNFIRWQLYKHCEQQKLCEWKFVHWACKSIIYIYLCEKNLTFFARIKKKKKYFTLIKKESYAAWKLNLYLNLVFFFIILAFIIARISHSKFTTQNLWCCKQKKNVQCFIYYVFFSYIYTYTYGQAIHIDCWCWGIDRNGAIAHWFRIFSATINATVRSAT